MVSSFDSFVPFEFTDSIPGPGGRVYSDNELVEKVLEARVNAVLKESAHRPWPMPAGPWVMAQSWHDLLFAHWQVDRTVLRSLLPSQLQVDTFEGHAWLAVVDRKSVV